MLGLRMRKGINKEKFRKKFQKDFDLCYNVEEIIKLGLLNDTKNSYFIPEEKWYISNEILLRILEKRK